ncbi:hypothetical protein BDB00DRAFT_816273 [Zychaea mexicana]|uniref:uncharacterized protein n=1 Tax=Zychaea mexicana TaxID=64656 RepID=UPI0022FE6B23|nr:uncharacterized protein BDB00DRAFT_816273 [Zychaea mexicana]KAI9494905.1 hypothetical protein BDB00DRAFT_816273 [Zychaea mexicana]
MTFHKTINNLGRVDQYRRCSSPRTSDILYFCFEDMTWTDESVKSVIKAFEHQFKDTALEAFRALEPTYADVQRRLVIEALFSDEKERRQILHKQNDGSYGDPVPGWITFTKTDSDKGSSTATFVCSEGDDASSRPIMRAQVLPALPQDTQYTRYVFRSLPLDTPCHARSVIRQAIIERQKATVHSETNVNLITFSQSVKETSMLIDADEKNVDKCIMDITASQGSGCGRYYYTGNVCIVLKNPVTLYDARKCQSFLVMYGNRTFYASNYSAHYLYCQRCHFIDMHCTDDCPV